MGIIGLAGGAQAFSQANGGKTYAYNGLTAAGLTQILPANPFRTKITFHNPGDVDILVAMQFGFSGPGGAQISLSPGTGSRGGAFLIFANGGTLIMEGECQMAWFAIPVSGSGKPLTVVDSNL